jgi:hypothetical protein
MVRGAGNTERARQVPQAGNPLSARVVVTLVAAQGASVAWLRRIEAADAGRSG